MLRKIVSNRKSNERRNDNLKFLPVRIIRGSVEYFQFPISDFELDFVAVTKWPEGLTALHNFSEAPIGNWKFEINVVELRRVDFENSF